MKKEIPWILIIQKLKHDITAEEEHDLTVWLAEDNHRVIFEELQMLWQRVQENAVDYTPDTNYYWQELSKRMKATEVKAEPSVHKTRFVSFKRFAAVASVFLLIVLSCTLYIGINLGRPESGAQVYTNLSGKSKVYLSDGTQVCLHTNTSLSLHTDFNDNSRLVNLLGEAYFDVKHDKDHPFVVETEGMKVVVHGTKFNVTFHPDSTNTYVGLVEGSVSLETSKEHRLMQPGEMATFNKLNNALSIERGDVHFMTSWANDKIIFNGESLGYICRFLSKWYSVKINLAPSLSDKYIYSFTLRHETLEEIVRIMARLNPLEYNFDEHNVLTIKEISSTNP